MNRSCNRCNTFLPKDYTIINNCLDCICFKCGKDLTTKEDGICSECVAAINTKAE